MVNEFRTVIARGSVIQLAVFVLVRAYNRLRGNTSEPAVPTTADCLFCRFTIPLGATRLAHCSSRLAT